MLRSDRHDRVSKHAPDRGKLACDLESRPPLQSLTDPADQPNAPSHAGHRERLRERARTGGPGALPDYELLELMLFRSIPQRDVKPLAKALLVRFGSLSAVFAADQVALCGVSATDNRGRALKVGAETALDLRLLYEATVRMSRAAVQGRPVISSWTALLSYVRTALAHEAREQFRVLFLDTKNQLIADEVMNQGTVNHAPVYPREIMRRALELSATAVILVHNHPSGDPTPSRADIDMTKQVIAAGNPLSVVVHDHLVVGLSEVASFKSLGLI